MIFVDKDYSCVSYDVYGYQWGDTAKVLEHSVMDNLYKTLNTRTQNLHWLMESQLEKSFILANPSLDDMVGLGLTTKCECGSHKTYGTKIEGWQHSSWCPIYSKK